MTRRAALCALGMVPGAAAQDILAAPPPKADARIPYGRDRAQFGDLRLPRGPGPHPVVIFIHGGFWKAAYDLNHAGHLCAALTQAGAATWSLEYRRIGQPGGGWPGTLDDALRGASHLPALGSRYPLSLDRVVIAGHSAGGQLALWVAAQRAIDLRAAIPLAAVSDLRKAWTLQLSHGIVGEFLGGSPDRVSSRYAAASPLELLPISIPQRLVHGTADQVVPFEMSEHFARVSRNARLLPLKGAGHFELIDPRSKEWPAVQKAILEWN